MTDNRATGWKIPLLFCGVILSIVAVAALFRAHAPEPPAAPQALLNEAKGIRIDLESDPRRAIMESPHRLRRKRVFHAGG